MDTKVKVICTLAAVVAAFFIFFYIFATHTTPVTIVLVYWVAVGIKNLFELVELLVKRNDEMEDKK